MIIYSVTVKIDLDVHNDWLHWMKNFHIPEVLNTKKFQDYRMLRVLAEDETDGITYNIQYRALSMSDYFDYQSNHAAALQNDHTERYKDKFVAFRTILKEVE
jgi:hypothetical protein